MSKNKAHLSSVHRRSKLFNRNSRDDTTLSSPTKNFGLSAEEFDELVQKLKGGDESLFKAIFLAHFEDCLKYLKHKFGLQHERAYDVTMDTLLLFRRKILEGKIKYGNIRFLYTRMASQLYLKQVDKQPIKEQVSEIKDLLEDEIDALDQEELDLLNKAWQKLCDDCRGLLKRVYYQKASLKEIAEEQNKTAAALRKQKQRCMEKLRLHFSQLYRL